jgi:hypothetical protein
MQVILQKKVMTYGQSLWVAAKSNLESFNANFAHLPGLATLYGRFSKFFEPLLAQRLLLLLRLVWGQSTVVAQ